MSESHIIAIFWQHLWSWPHQQPKKWSKVRPFFVASLFFGHPEIRYFRFFWFSCFFRGVCFSEAVLDFFWKLFCIYGCPNVSLVSHGPKISLKRIVISLGVLLVTKPLGATSKNPMLLPCLNHILLQYLGSIFEAGRIKYDFVGHWLCWTGLGDCWL